MEHIIPEGLGGELLLPEASCGRCEDMTNRSESFCQRQTLKAFRLKYIPNATKRKKNQPKQLQVEYREEGIIKKKMVDIANYPVHILLPSFPLPEVLLPQPVRRSNILQMKSFPAGEQWSGDNAQLHIRSQPAEIYATLETDDVIVETGRTDSYRFGRMLAKIAHSYAVAELGYDAFLPFLLPAISGQKEFPIHHVVGGITEETPPTAERHSISLYTERHHGKSMWIANIRLFGDLGFPEYRCVVGLDRHERHVLPVKMQLATPYGLQTTPLKLDGIMLESDGIFECLCALCNHALTSGVRIEQNQAVRCFHCRQWNVNSETHEPWSTPFDQLAMEEPTEFNPRAIWIKSSNSIKSDTKSL